MPAMPHALTVPLSKPSGMPRGCTSERLSVPVPPKRIGSRGMSRSKISIPTPCGPCSPLCAASAYITPRLSASGGLTCPAPCAPSMSTKMPLCAHRSQIFSTSLASPVTFETALTATSLTLPSSSGAMSSAVIASPCEGVAYTTFTSFSPRNFSRGRSTELCSVTVVTTVPPAR